jgi:heme-degrading monooxygenase HmoA
MAFARTPPPPYYAVIFSNQHTDDLAGYGAMAEDMERLALAQPGCLGAESARDADGFGITVSYWQSEAAMLAWKQNSRHLIAQATGKARWYEHYITRVAKVERDYEGPEGR